MQVRHIGLVYRSKEDADRFFTGFLGLKMAEQKKIPPSLALALFAVEGEIEVVNYLGEGLHFEVFIHDDPAERPGRIAHVCLEVGNQGEFLDRARAKGVVVLRFPKGEGWVTFIEDGEGHRFEIK